MQAVRTGAHIHRWPAAAYARREAAVTRYENMPLMAVGPGYYACPICRRTVERKDSADGFRKAGLSSHIYACWEKGLATAGLAVGSWSSKHNGHRIIKAKRPTLTPAEKP